MHRRMLILLKILELILRPYVLPFLRDNEGGILMHDNAPPHTTRVTKEFLINAGVEVLSWPAVSPYLNPIEMYEQQ